MSTFLLPSVSGLSRIGIWGPGEDYRFCNALHHELQGGGGIRHGICAMGDHKAMIDRIAGVPDPISA